MPCVATRPLLVEELAEVLTVDFHHAEGLPKLKASWRWWDQEQALLSSCSSLIAIVNTGHSRVVQFSHFSVKEFLTSPFLVQLETSRFIVFVFEPAHTIMAQAYLSTLLQSDDRVGQTGVGKTSPPCQYAARHWVTHAQFEGPSSRLRRAMEYLFHLDNHILPLGSACTT
jgi:hypothetical protein